MNDKDNDLSKFHYAERVDIMYMWGVFIDITFDIESNSKRLISTPL